MKRKMYGNRGRAIEKTKETIRAIRRVVKALESLGEVAYGIQADADLETYRHLLDEAISERVGL